MRPSTRRQEVVLRGDSESERLTRGGNHYVADLIGVDHLWGRVVRSDVAHGRILSLDTAAASAVEGVRVFTAADFADSVPAIPLRNSTTRLEELRQPVLADGVVRYVGEPIAFVVAESAMLAEDAAGLITADIETLPVVLHPDERQGAPDDRGDGDGRLAASHVTSGDVDSAFDRAYVAIRGRYTVQRVTGVPMETRGLIAEWDEDSGVERLHVWGPTKYIYFTRRALAELLDLEPAQVIVHAVDVGGMFGVRGEFYPEDFLVPWAARQAGRPVAWIEDRREHMLSMNHSREQTHDYEIAVDRHGKLLAFRDVVSIDAGAYARPIGPRQVPILVHCLPGPYAWEAMEMSVASVTTNKTPVGNMRGPGGTEAGFVRERAIDRAAHALGMDPLDLRRRNLVTSTDLPYEIDLGDGHPIVYDSGDFEQIVDTLLELTDVATIREELTTRRESGEWVGLGFAFFAEHSGNGQTETIEADLGEDGLLTISTGACDIGQGLTGFILQLCAEELGIGREHLRVLSGDSRADVDARGTFGSRTAIFVGNAVTNAVAELRGVALGRASSQLGVPVDRLHIESDGISSGSDFLHWKEVAPITVTGTHEGDVVWGFGAHLAVVSVDPGTFDVEVERLAVIYDCGRIVDRQAVEGQLRGGAVLGLGGALYEEIPYDELGQPLATNLMDYLIPCFGDVPEVEVFAVEAGPAPGNPLGIKGAGEAGVLGVGGAVANAVAAALGPEAGDKLVGLPLRPDRLFELAVPSQTGGTGE